MEYLLPIFHVFLQIIIGIDLIAAQSESITYRSVKENATIVGVEPFYSQTTFSITECYLMCHRQIEKCSFVEVANVNEAWSCKLFHFNTSQDIKKHLRPSKGSGVSAPKLPKPKPKPKDCGELKGLGFKDGVYTISFGSVTKNVFCDMTTDGGGWIVMQRIFNGSVDFNRDWNTYKDGFGNVYGDHWIGNEFVHQYTNAYPTEMIAEGTASDGKRVSAKMGNFSLGDEASDYVLKFDECIGLADTFDGCNDWGSQINSQRNMKFTTFDRDNDHKNVNCAVKYHTGWWYNECYKVKLNGKYSPVETSDDREAPHWDGFRYFKSLKETKMLVRHRMLKL